MMVPYEICFRLYGVAPRTGVTAENEYWNHIQRIAGAWMKIKMGSSPSAFKRERLRRKIGEDKERGEYYELCLNTRIINTSPLALDNVRRHIIWIPPASYAARPRPAKKTTVARKGKIT